MPAAGAPPWALPLEIPPALVAAVPLATLVWLGWLGVRGGLLEGAARRPARALVSGVVVVVLVVPFPVRLETGGGNSARDPVYRWVMEDAVGNGLVEVDADGLLVRHPTARAS